jgi:hypothetical protein
VPACGRRENGEVDLIGSFSFRIEPLVREGAIAMVYYETR